jgi:repressor LexA
MKIQSLDKYPPYSQGIGIMVKLTPRQQQILDLIRQSVRDTGRPPTRAEIAARFGFRSPNAAEEHLKALARKGVIELSAGTSRGIRLAGSIGQQAIEAAESRLGQLLELPLVGRVAAGSPILAAEHIDTTLGLDASLFGQTPDYLLRVRGMSMRDAGILDGDLLAVRRSNTARNGQIVVARLSDEVTVKRLQQYADRIELLPENPDYAPIVVRPGQDFNIEGIAVGLVRGGLAL